MAFQWLLVRKVLPWSKFYLCCSDVGLLLTTRSIVFIHGFTGHPERTWSRNGVPCNDPHQPEDDAGERPTKFQKLPKPRWLNQRSGGSSRTVFWPRDLVPLTAPDARVLTYGYDTRLSHWLGPLVSQNTVYDIGWDFLVSLGAERQLEPSRPLLFIAHSLGGVIVKEALRRSHGCQSHNSHLRKIYESTSSIFFFGTPHGGADPRGWLQHVAEKIVKAAGLTFNKQIVDALLPSSERLRDLREGFGRMIREKSWVIYSFQEQYGVNVLSNNKVGAPDLI